MKQNEKPYIQVSDDISSTATFTREISPLLQIRDAFPKTVITRTKHGVSSYEGVKIVDVARWLLGEE